MPPRNKNGRRCSVTSASSTPKDVLCALSKHATDRAEAARMTSRVTLLRTLATDESVLVRHAVMINPNTPDSVLRSMEITKKAR